MGNTHNSGQKCDTKSSGWCNKVVSKLKVSAWDITNKPRSSGWNSSDSLPVPKTPSLSDNSASNFSKGSDDILENEIKLQLKAAYPHSQFISTEIYKIGKEYNSSSKEKAVEHALKLVKQRLDAEKDSDDESSVDDDDYYDGTPYCSQKKLNKLEYNHVKLFLENLPL